MPFVRNRKAFEGLYGAHCLPFTVMVKPQNPIATAKRIARAYTYSNNLDLLRQIIESYGIMLDYWPLMEISGMFWYAPDKKPTIAVNSEHPPVRQRFTIAHEIGHFMLDHGKYFVCLDLEGDYRRNLLERHANQFAAELLMPFEKITAQIKKNRNIREIAQHFQVSREAAYWRIENTRKVMK
ncbi:MAG: hypothetical protein AVO34_05260 [Firmicutes bacterium ML8_F2]|nr:MAG: hypothetical protein AVO34_05260 [Firmicutes bacterium ML8_F2]